MQLSVVSQQSLLDIENRPLAFPTWRLHEQYYQLKE
jgi:hypothetical protein